MGTSTPRVAFFLMAKGKKVTTKNTTQAKTTSKRYLRLAVRRDSVMGLSSTQKRGFAHVPECSRVAAENRRSSREKKRFGGVEPHQHNLIRGKNPSLVLSLLSE